MARETAVARERFTLTEERDWPGQPVLREIRQLTMTTWIVQDIGELPAVAAEFATRVASLRERDTTRAWNPF